MTKEELDRVVREMPKEDQMWLLNRIIWRWWPQFQGKAVGFYDPAESWDDWNDKELDEFYNRKWQEAEQRWEDRLQAGGCGDSQGAVLGRGREQEPAGGGTEFP